MLFVVLLPVHTPSKYRMLGTRCYLFPDLDVDEAECNVSTGKAALVSLTIVSLLLILFLATSTAVFALCLLKLRETKSRNNEWEITPPSRDVESSENVATGDRIGSNQSSNGDTRDIKGLKCEKYVPYGMTTYMPQHTTGNVSKTKSTASPTVNNVDCKKNAAYEGATSKKVSCKGLPRRKQRECL